VQRGALLIFRQGALWKLLLAEASRDSREALRRISGSPPGLREKRLVEDDDRLRAPGAADRSVIVAWLLNLSDRFARFLIKRDVLEEITATIEELFLALEHWLCSIKEAEYSLKNFFTWNKRSI